MEKQEAIIFQTRDPGENLCQIRFLLLTYIQVTFNESDELIFLNYRECIQYFPYVFPHYTKTIDIFFNESDELIFLN